MLLAKMVMKRETTTTTSRRRIMQRLESFMNEIEIWATKRKKKKKEKKNMVQRV